MNGQHWGAGAEESDSCILATSRGIMSTPAAVPGRMTKEQKRVAGATMVGTTVEW